MKSTNVEICDIIMDIATLWKLHFCLFLLNPKYHQNEVWSNILKQTFLACFWFNAEGCKLVPGPFMIIMKWQYNEICQFLVADIYHFYLPLIHPFKKTKHWKLELKGY